MIVVLGSKGIFLSTPLYSIYSSYPLFVMLRFAQNDSHNIMGYIFVTRDWVMLLGCGRGCIECVLFVVGQCKIHAHKLDYYVIISYICSV